MTATNRPFVPHVLVITDDVLGSRMAGPAIRAVEIAKVLAEQQPVSLVSAAGGRIDVDGVEGADPVDLRDLVTKCDVMILQGAVLLRHPWLHDIPQPIVVDLYDPFHLEALHLESGDRLRDVDLIESTLRTLSDQIVRGDFFMCATERQRDLWLGHLGAMGRLNHLTRHGDPEFRSLIDLVPFGIPDVPPTADTQTFHDVIPQIGSDDVVAFWAGGIYDWFDPITLIDAVAEAQTDPRLHLVFLAGRHPNPNVPDMAGVAEARRHAAALGVAGRRVHFIDEWTPYDERQKLLLAADIGVTTHHRGVETAFSFRTRMLDYLWAGLPIICTEGDELSVSVASAGAGLTVAAGDAEALRSALVFFVNDTDARRAAGGASTALGRHFRWSDVISPLRHFTMNPTTAADRLDPVTRTAIAMHRPPPQSGLGHMFRRSKLHWSAGGTHHLIAAIRRKLPLLR